MISVWVLNIYGAGTISVGQRCTKGNYVLSCDRKMLWMLVWKNEGKVDVGKFKQCPAFIMLGHIAYKMPAIPSDRLVYILHLNCNMVDMVHSF